MHPAFAPFSVEARLACAAVDWNYVPRDCYDVPFPRIEGLSVCPLGVCLHAGGYAGTAEVVSGSFVAETLAGAGIVGWDDEPAYYRRCKEFMERFDRLPGGQRNAFVQECLGIGVVVEQAAVPAGVAP